MKSNVSDSFLEVVTSIYIDACNKCIAKVSDLRDLETIRSRVKEEGVSFLTITLPAFCRDFETSLQLGQIDPAFFRSFRKKGPIPLLLGGMTGLIFDRETGRIHEKQSPFYQIDCSTLVESVRQICLAFQRVELECAPQRVAKSISDFTSIERFLKMSSMPKRDTEEFTSVSRVLWDNSIACITSDRLVPRHGPGTTAEHITGNQKYAWQRWHDRLEPYFPIIDSAYSISAFGELEFELVTIVSQDQEQPVRVVTVPKTLKGPRIIAIEPCCMQYAQQAIRHVLYDMIESSELTKGHVNFRDQSVNQSLAITSSATGQFATIDLSDASDRVPRELALEMFSGNPDLRDAIDACRSKSAELPTGGIISPLSKFASMGSALCFPVESMYFYTICVAALLSAQNLPVSHANALIVSRDVYVYGDDLIVPQKYAMIVLDYLQKYYCKVNTSKTFVTGRFRESCGVDAYDGELVTPVYLRTTRPQNMRQVAELVSWTASANLFYKKGYWRTAQLMWHTCERFLGSLPYVSDTSSALGRVSYLGYRSVERWNRFLQRFEIKGWIPSPVYRSDSIDGYSALMKCLLILEGKDQGQKSKNLNQTGRGNRNWEIPSLSVAPDQQDWWTNPLAPITEKDPLHLERSALRGAVALKRRWVPST